MNRALHNFEYIGSTNKGVFDQNIFKFFYAWPCKFSYLSEKLIYMRLNQSMLDVD